MLYYLFEWLDKTVDFPGAGVFQYISFRAGMAIVISLIITAFFGNKLISFLRRKQVGETVRDLGLQGQKEKEGTPTMGGLIIIAGILIPVLLLNKLDNIYIILMIFTTLWLGMFGFMDDYIKVFRKRKEGMSGKTKIIGQVILGLVVGCTLYFSNDVVIKDFNQFHPTVTEVVDQPNCADQTKDIPGIEASKSTKTTIPFVKNNELDYSIIISWMGDNAANWTFLIFIPIVILIITAVSNGANLTDGMDGLATSNAAVIGATLAGLAWVSGNIIFADYLNIMYIPNVGEMVIFGAAFVGSCIGFMWYNSYPAQVFMGDTGSLTIGGIIAVFAIIIRKELLLPLLCGIFLIESLSVIMQVSYFKYTKKKYGEGRRIFMMSPLHHHYQKKGIPEPKIVQRFLIIAIGLAVLTIVTLKLR
ncbi:MAG: phospho-N-acetylmuramoyl-pentapeptide-transferase [Bacteroidales bacterium]|nr:phospho-N-acetylmuramoyl-pentapeptide-transferase [Bacteroidales bacterium]